MRGFNTELHSLQHELCEKNEVLTINNHQLKLCQAQAAVACGVDSFTDREQIHTVCRKFAPFVVTPLVSSRVVIKNWNWNMFLNDSTPLFTDTPCYLNEWHKRLCHWHCLLHLHSGMNFNGASGLWHPIGANLCYVITVRWHPPQTIQLWKQVNPGNAVVLWNTKRKCVRISHLVEIFTYCWAFTWNFWYFW